MNELIKKLKYIDNSVYCDDWNVYRKLSTGVQDKKYEILKCNYNEYSFNDDYIINKLLDKSEYNYIWITYQGCIDMFFNLREDYLECKVTVYNGRRLDGSRESKRFIVTVKVDLEFIENLNSDIDNSFERKLEVEYNQYLYNKKIEWITKRQKSILKE